MRRLSRPLSHIDPWDRLLDFNLSPFRRRFPQPNIGSMSAVLVDELDAGGRPNVT